MKALIMLAACALAAGAAVRPAAAPAQQARAERGGTEDPVAYVRGIYARSGRRGAAAAPQAFNGYSHEPIFSPRLQAMFADDEHYANGEVGRLEVNPFTGAQDDDIRNARVTAVQVEGNPDRRVVTARFRNMRQPTTMVFFFERIAGRWYIDDIAKRAPAGWTLSLILRYGRS